MKKRTQGEAPRIEACPEGGEHVLMRPVQIYCDRCRPKQRQQTLERQRTWRERQRSIKHGALAPAAATGPAFEAAGTSRASVAAATSSEQRIAELAAELGLLTGQLAAAYQAPERAMPAHMVDRAADLSALASQTYVAARRLLPDAAPADELAARRDRGSG